MNLAIRKKLVDSLATRLERKSIRMTCAGIRNREKFAAAFVDTMESQGDVEDFRAKCVDMGISPMLIMLLLSIAWDILWYWWQNREGAK